MIEGVDYNLNDVYGHEGKFTVWNVRCPKCQLPPGLRCDPITRACSERTRHYANVETYLLNFFPHPDDMNSWDFNAWVAHSMVWLNTDKTAMAHYGEARTNALLRNDLKTLRTLHEFMDFRAKHKLKGSNEAKR